MGILIGEVEMGSGGMGCCKFQVRQKSYEGEGEKYEGEEEKKEKLT